MKKYLTILFSALLLTFSTISSAITLTDLQQLFSKNQVVRADFVQDRYINGLTAIFTADKDMLESNFDITVTEQNKYWTVTLQPKLAPLNKIFKQIILNGKSYLEKVTINDMQNDKTELTFANHKTMKLSQNEQLLFR